MSASPAAPVRGGLVAAAGLIAVMTLAARVMGFGRWVVFSGTVGSSCVGSVYQAANQLPNVLFEVAAGGALAAVAVPLIAGHVGRGERSTADHIASALLTRVVVVLVPLAVLLALLARPLSGLLLQGRQCPGAVDLATQMLAVFAPQVALYGIGIVLAGVLQAHRRFLAAALAPLLSSVVAIATYLLYARLAGGHGNDLRLLPASAAYTLSAGTTLGVVALSLPLLLPVHRAGVRLRPTWRFPAGVGRRAVSLAGAGVLALLAQQVTVLVTVWLALNRGGAGALPVYTYVQAVYLLPYAVLAVPVAISAFPALAAGTAMGEVGQQATSATLSRSLRAVAVAGALGAGVLAATAVPVGAFFGAIDAGRGSPAGSAALAAMPGALVSFAPGLVGFALAALLTRALYVRGRPSRAAAAMAAGWLFAAAVPLLVLLGGRNGPSVTLAALGWSSSGGMTLAAALQALAVRRSWGPAGWAGVGRSLGVGLVAAAAAGAAGLLLARWWDPVGWSSAVVAGVALGGLALLVFAGVMAVGDRAVVALLLARVRRRPDPASTS